MIGLILRAPMIAAVLLPIVGALLSGGLQELRYQWIVIPHALELQRVELVKEYELRVERAKQEEQLRQFRIIERLTEKWAEQLELELADYAAKVDLLEEEIEAYEDAEGDTQCRLDQGDLDFLLGAHAAGRQLQPHNAATGGR